MKPVSHGTLKSKDWRATAVFGNNETWYSLAPFSFVAPSSWLM